MADGLPARFRRGKRWSCPNHPDGPPAVFGDLGESTHLDDQTSFDPDDLELVVDRARNHPATAIREAGERLHAQLGLCCRGHRWAATGPWKPYYSSAFEALHAAQHSINWHLSQHSVLLEAILADREHEPGVARIPIIYKPTDEGGT